MQEQVPLEEHAAEEKLNWLRLATKFSSDGDLKGMRACAQEVERLKAGDVDAAAVNAEVALYSGRTDEAETLADQVLSVQPRHPRARMVKAGLAALDFRLDDEITLLADLIEELSYKEKLLGSEDLSAAGLPMRSILSAKQKERRMNYSCRAVSLMMIPLQLSFTASISSCETIVNSEHKRDDRRQSITKSCSM